MGTRGEHVMQQDKEWVIQRCTQRWVGFQLEYEDFPTPEGLMTRDLMLTASGACLLGNIPATNSEATGSVPSVNRLRPQSGRTHEVIHQA